MTFNNRSVEDVIIDLQTALAIHLGFRDDFTILLPKETVDKLGLTQVSGPGSITFIAIDKKRKVNK
jgi:hypothetical protein